MNIIDFECDTPTREAVEDTVRLIRSGRGFDKEGYAQLMAPGWAAQIGIGANSGFIPRIAFRFLLGRPVPYAVLAFLSAPLMHLVFVKTLGWTDYMPFLKFPR